MRGELVGDFGRLLQLEKCESKLMTKKKNDPGFSGWLADLLSFAGSMLSLARSHAPRRHSPRKRIRKRIVASILLAVIVCSFSLASYNLVGERFNDHIINALGRITGGEVDIERSQINILSDIRINRLKVYIPGKSHDDRYLIFSAEDILLAYDPWSIFTAQLKIDKIVASHALLNMSYDHNGKQWNINQLKLKLPSSSGSRSETFPEFIIRDSYIQYQESHGNIYSLPVRQEFNGKIARSRDEKIILFDFASDDLTMLPNCSIAGSYDPEKVELEARMKFDMENFATDSLPPNLVAFRELYKTIKPRGEVVLKSVYSKSAGNQVSVVFDNASASIDWLGSGAELPLPSISGEVVCTTQMTQVNDITVNYADASFSVSGRVNGYSGDSQIDLEISSKGLNLPRDQWDSFDIMTSSIFDVKKLNQLSEQAIDSGSFKPVLNMLVSAMPDKNKKIFNDFLPTGKADVDIFFIRQDGKNAVVGDIDLIDVAGRFIKFPYAVGGVSGKVSFEPGYIDFGPIVTKDEGMDVAVNGSAFKNEQNKWDISADVDIKNITVSQKLYKALNEKQQKIFDLFEPVGDADAHYNVHVIRGEKPDDHLDIKFRNCDAVFRLFPVELKDCYGEVNWDRKHTSFKVERAVLGGGSLEVAGSLDVREGQTILDCDLEFDKVALEPTLVKELPSAIRGFYDKVSARGELSGSGKVSKVFDVSLDQIVDSEEKLAPPEHNIDLKLVDGSMVYSELPIPLEDVEARVNISNSVLTIKEFSAVYKNAIDSGSRRAVSKELGPIVSPVQLKGTIEKGGADIRLWSDGLYLRSEIRDYVEGRFPGLWQKYTPEGIADVDISFKTGVGKSLKYNCDIKPVEMNASFMGYPLRALGGRMILSPGMIELKAFTVQNGQIVVDAELGYDGDSRNYQLELNTEKLPIDEALKQAFADKVYLLGEEFDLTGELTSEVKIHADSDSPDEMSWLADGRATLIDGSAKLPLESKGVYSDFDFEIVYEQGKGGLELKAESDNFSALVKERPVKNGVMKLDYNSDDKVLDVNVPSVRFCDGPASGSFNALLDGSGTYSVILNMKRASLEQLVQAKEDNISLKGVADGVFKLSSVGETKKGSFEFQVYDATLGKLPLLVGMLNLVNITSSHEGAFNRASISGDIVNDRTQFSELTFKGGSIEVTGKGSMVGPFSSDGDKLGDIDLSFMVEAPDIIKPIPFIGSFFNAIRSGIIYVQASGKYDKPVIKPVTFSVINDLFKDYRTRRKIEVSEPSVK